MQESIKNKRLYEEQFVKKIVEIAVLSAIKQKIVITDIKKFINENFDVILKQVIDIHE